jgi:hypothetical protein
MADVDSTNSGGKVMTSTISINEAARQAVASPANLARFGERGFRTIISGRVVGHLVATTGVDADEALVAAHQAIEEVGGLVVGVKDRPGLRSLSRTPYAIHEVWMIPETAVLANTAPAVEDQPRAA